MNASSWSIALGWALLHFVWQGTLIGAIAATWLAALRGARPQARYAVACAALAACVLWPAWQFWHGLPLIAGGDAAVIAGDDVAGLPAMTGVATHALHAWQPSLQAQLPALVTLWALGAATLGLRLLAGLAWVGRLQRRTELHPRWQGRLDALAARVGLRRAVGLRVTDDTDSPLAAGWWRPVVIVPTALIAHMPADLLEALLAHELAHIRRHDYLVNLAQHAVEALLFYHPVVWWLSRRIRDEREQIADDIAARALGEPRRLALALQELERFQFDTTPLALAAHGGHLMSRIQRLLRPIPQVAPWRLALPLLGASALCVVAYAQSPAPAPAVTAAAPVTVPVAAPAVAPSVVAAPGVVAAPFVDAAPITAALAGSGDELTDALGDAALDADRRHTRYAVVHAGEDDIRVFGDSDDRDTVERLRQRIGGDFLWVQRDGRQWLIRDPALIARVDAAWSRMRPLDAQMRALNESMRPHQAEMEAMSARMRALEAEHQPDDAALDALGKQLEPLAAKQEALAREVARVALQDLQADESERESLHAERARLESQIDTLTAQMRARSEQLARQLEPLQAMAREMSEAAKPMQALGAKMSALGRQIGDAARSADRESRAGIDAALRAGKATPID